MPYLIFGLLISSLAAWIWAEYQVRTPPTRLTIGAVPILILGAMLYATEVARFYRESHYSAAIRLLGEALEDSDLESARNAIREYNAQGPRQSGYIIVHYLANQKRKKTQ